MVFFDVNCCINFDFDQPDKIGKSRSISGELSSLRLCIIFGGARFDIVGKAVHRPADLPDLLDTGFHSNAVSLSRAIFWCESYH